MAERKKIDPDVNWARVKASMERRGTQRINIYLEKGTLERINALGFKVSTFARKVIMEELDRLENENHEGGEDNDKI